METFHGLKLLAHCGGGAYGDVYYCEDISGRKMAVKIVSKKRLGDSWERELKGVINYRKITENAPGLLQIFHVEEDVDSFFYTMEPADSASDAEYIPDTLAHRLHSGPLPQTDLLRILSGIFDGIKLIHSAGFTHRDIKPDNILFVKGVPKLADIGLLSSLSNTMTQLAGTLEFIPPEERGADSLESSNQISRQRNDLYAFGKVVYCAATGMSPHEYPTVPKELPLSLPLKYFLRLAFQLCSKDPVQRLNSLEELAGEFADIERKLLYGENFNDKLKYAVKQLFSGIKSTVFSSLRFMKRFWYLMLLCLLIGGGVSYKIKKPEKPIDMAKIESKFFRSRHSNLSMTIPAQWEPLTDEMIQDEMKKGNEQNPERMMFYKGCLQMGMDWLCIDFLNNNPEGVTIQYIKNSNINLFDMPYDEMRIKMKKSMQAQYGENLSIYELKKVTVAGYKSIYADYSGVPGYRGAAYYFQENGTIIIITLSRRADLFMKSKKEFDAALRTLSIGK